VKGLFCSFIKILKIDLIYKKDLSINVNQGLNILTDNRFLNN